MNTTAVHEVYLAGIVAVSLVLPVRASWLNIPSAMGPSAMGSRPWRRIVGAGQAVAAMGAMWVIFSPYDPVYGLGMTMVGCALFNSRLNHLCVSGKAPLPNPGSGVT